MGKSGKSRSSANKRFKLTGGGKIVRRRGRFTHLLTKKSSARKRRLGEHEAISPSDAQNVRRMMNG